MPEKLLAIRRSIVPADHEKLRAYIPTTNHALADLQPKWRKRGTAGVTLLERGEYQRVAEYQRSLLATAKTDALARTINSDIIPRMPTEHRELEVPVTGVGFIGNGSFPGVAFLLESDTLMQERERITQLLEKMSGLKLFLRDFVPHFTIATIDKINAEERVLEVFEEIAPDSIRFQGVVATSN